MYMQLSDPEILIVVVYIYHLFKTSMFQGWP